MAKIGLKEPKQKNQKWSLKTENGQNRSQKAKINIKTHQTAVSLHMEVNNMKGSVKWQINQIFYESGINQIGQSKHQAKEALKTKLSGKSPVTWHVIGQNIGIFSYKTADNYREIWRQVASFAKENYKIRDVQKIDGQHIKEFIQSKIEKKVSLSMYQQYVAALYKFEMALNGYAQKHNTGNAYDFKQQIQETKSSAYQTLIRNKNERNYENPSTLIDHIKNDEHKLVAKIQYESGCRVSECTHLSLKNLKGLGNDPVTGEQKGVLYIEKAKGGKNGFKYVSVETYQKLEERLNAESSGKMSVNNGEYRNSLKKAAIKTDQQYTGSHGLRWNYAQERYEKILELTHNEAETLALVSKDLFHERLNITKHYLSSAG